MIKILNEQGHGCYYHTAGEVAKALKLTENGKVLGRNKFLSKLRDNNILMKNNEAYQVYINLDLIIVHNVKKKNYSMNMTLFSDKGLNWLKNRFGVAIEEKIEHEYMACYNCQGCGCTTCNGSGSIPKN